MDNALGGMFTRPTQKRSGVDTFAAALQGFGAGVQGRGPEFLAMQQAQQQELSKERQTAMAEDAFKVFSLLEGNRLEDAISLVDNRVQMISELGGDPSDTLGIRQLIVGGQIPQAKQELQDFLGQAQRAGVFQLPQSEAFTLSPGQVRFENGRPVAQVDEREPDAVRSLRARAAEAGLQPGTPEFQEFMAQGGRTPSDPARERQIADLMNTFGLTRQQALSSMEEKTVVDPTTGNLMIYNPITQQGRVAELDVPGDVRQVGQPPRVTEADLAFDPGKGTGFASSFLGLWNQTVGQVPFIPISRDRALAAQNLRILERDAINALASSSRPAVVEQERIIQALPRAMEWFENPDDARIKMTSFVDLMTQQYVDDLRYSSNMRNPRTLREESARRASEVERMMARVLTPEASQQMFQSINRIEGELLDITQTPDAELITMDPMKMSDSQLDAYIERLRNAGR